MLATLAVGLVATYFLIRAIGVIGAAVGDNIIEVIYVLAHLWICSQLIPLDLNRLLWSTVRTALAAVAMGLVLLAVGTGSLSVGDWIIGGVGGLLAFGAVVLATRELTVDELRGMAGKLRAGLRGGR